MKSSFLVKKVLMPVARVVDASDVFTSDEPHYEVYVGVKRVFSDFDRSKAIKATYDQSKKTSFKVSLIRVIGMAREQVLEFDGVLSGK